MDVLKFLPLSFLFLMLIDSYLFIFILITAYIYLYTIYSRYHLDSKRYQCMKKVVVFTGAGISAESGLATFRDSGGLWEQYKIENVATPEAFAKNPDLVLNFYNIRRKQLLNTKPNKAHIALNRLSSKYKLSIITQNIDDLHERSGSKNILHLHGKLMESKECKNK